MKTELQEYLEQADAKDLLDCLKEHFEEDKLGDKHFEMISLLYWNDKTHFNVLSPGCKASILIYLALRGK